jgi:hypothetical protein
MPALAVSAHVDDFMEDIPWRITIKRIHIVLKTLPLRLLASGVIFAVTWIGPVDQAKIYCSLFILSFDPDIFS